ncbi:MAG: hypothetical protein Q9196_000983 [Gyalolechia fulgens]
MTEKKQYFQLPPSISRSLAFISSQLPPLNFITLHYAYFVGVPLLASLIFWGSSTPAKSISYVDSLYLVVSAMSLTGLNTVNLSGLNTFQQIILFLLIMLGSTILVSFAVVFVRLKAFERRFQTVVEEEKRKQKDRGSLRRKMTLRSNSVSKRPTGLDTGNGKLRGRPGKSAALATEGIESKDLEMGGRASPIAEEGHHETSTKHQPLTSSTNTGRDKAEQDKNDEYIELANGTGRKRGVTFSQTPAPALKVGHLARILSMQGVGARHDIRNHPTRTPPPENLPSPSEEHHGSSNKADLINHFSIPGIIGRNSHFYNLSIADRERLGGVEYRALELLAMVIPLYFVAWQFLGSIGMAAWIKNNSPDLTEGNGLNPWWVGAFNAVSGFNNSGMSLLDANMVAFQTSRYMLITVGLLILAGNTCYPIFLRLILWTIWDLLRFLPENDKFIEYRVTLRFLLDHPRRCYTNLFPSRHTWWLLAVLLTLTGIDWIAFEVLNIGNDAIYNNLSAGTRALDGLFQSLAVRTGGFYVVTILNLRIGLLILYVIMMYISVYPVVITMRNSNVYEERSLDIYSSKPEGTSTDSPDGAELQQTSTSTTRKPDAPITGIKRRITVATQGSSSKSATKETRSYFVRQQLRAQLAHDLWWVVLAILIITTTETSLFEKDPVTYSVFNVIFEVISAYGTVGLSIGLPTQSFSFSGDWHKFSKLVLCAVMIRGRHRGLPVAIDRAVLLPGEHLAAAEEEDALIRIERSATRVAGERA